MLESYERELMLRELTSSEVELLQCVDGLSAAQWTFRENPERWSIAENIEHLVAFEGFIMSAVQRVLSEDATPDKQADAETKQPLVLGLSHARAVKFVSREANRPVGKWSDPSEALLELKRARARSIAFAAETQADLRAHFFPHIAFGDLDCFQWVVLLGQHTRRHLLQIQQVTNDSAYPRSTAT